MAQERLLPSRRNPYLVNGDAYDELVAARTLQHHNIVLKPGCIGLNNASRPQNLGGFDYASLSVPLPPAADLGKAELFQRYFSQRHRLPKAYFLMRRSYDGKISATGLYRATFPQSTIQQEKHERQYVRSLACCDSQEVVNNLWVDEATALALAADYKIELYARALLDPSPIVSPSSQATSHISIAAPPTFDMARHHDRVNGVDATPKSTRKDRSLRSVSPTKLPPPSPDSRPKASPKRRLKNKKEKKEKTADGAKSSSRKLQAAIDDASIADSAAETEEPDEEQVVEAAGVAADAIAEKVAEEAAEVVAEAADELAADGLDAPAKIAVTSDEQHDGDVDATRTKVTVEMPAGSEAPENAEEAIAAAKAIVKDAKALQVGEVDGAAPKAGKKRKADELEVENPEEELVTELVDGDTVAGASEGASASPGKQVTFGERTEEPPTKRTRVMVPADEFRREKMQKRAFLGLTATVAVGALIPFVSNLF